jgi:fructosamine-3-kinase
MPGPGRAPQQRPVSASLQALVDHLDARGVTPVAGGDIAGAYRVETPEGPVFVKHLPQAPPGLFEREAAGLRVLRAVGALSVPEVLHVDDSGLVLEWVEAAPRGVGDDAAFGRALAMLHATHGPHFGAVDDQSRGCLGTVEVDLTPASTWAESYLVRRVLPLAQRCVEMRRLDPVQLGAVERLVARGEDLCGPPEPPSLVHGDLWAGNRMVDTAGRHWLVDPAVSWSHRELDLSMMRLFGGFGEAAFTAYQEVTPLQPGWRDRDGLHRLLPLLVHVILFGEPYAVQVVRALDRLDR